MSAWKTPFKRSFSIDNRQIGEDAPTYVVAEIGANHDGKLPRGKELIRTAAEAGADAVKFQTLNYDALFHDPTTDEAVAELYDRIEIPKDWYSELQAVAERAGVTFFTSVTYPGGIKLLSDLDIQAYKIASAQVVADIPLIETVAKEGRPMILSTGLGGYGHIERALDACLSAGNHDVAILHCISEYPTPLDEVELSRIGRLQSAFGIITGFSDHTESAIIPAASVALGAAIIEKHITLDRSSPGPDHEFALEPGEFSTMVQGIREVEAAMGSGLKFSATEDEQWLRDHVQMKLVAQEDIAAGSLLTEEIVTARRAPEGIPRNLIGDLEQAHVTTSRALKEGSLITWESIIGNDD